MLIASEEGSLSVSFEITRADLEASVAHQLRGTPAKRSIRQTFFMLLLVAILVGMLVFKSAPAGPVRWIVLAGFAIFAVWLLAWVLRLNKDPVAQAVDHVISACGEEAVLGPERITISSAGVRSDHGFCTLMYRWSGVKSIDMHEEALLIATNTTMNFRIPRRAFASDAAMHEFVDRARRWHVAEVS